MSHMVIYRGPDGKPGYRQTEDIHDAVSFVEQLRNDQGVEQAKIFRMEEINFDYRPYYRVELKASEPMLSSVPSKPAVAAAPEQTVAEEPEAEVEAEAEVTELKSAPEVKVPAEDGPAITAPTTADADSGIGARRGLFGR